MDGEVALTAFAVVAPMLAVFLAAMTFAIRWIVKSILDAGLAGVNAKIDTGLVQLNAKIDTGLVQLNARIDGLEDRVDRLSNRVDRLSNRVDRLSNTVEKIAKRQIANDAWRLEADNRLTRIENRQMEAALPLTGGAAD